MAVYRKVYLNKTTENVCLWVYVKIERAVLSIIKKAIREMVHRTGIDDIRVVVGERDQCEYDVYTGTIYISQHVLPTVGSNNKEFVRSLAHEWRHALQHLVGDLIFDEYICPEEDFFDYWYQDVERDARSYAERVVSEYCGVTFPYVDPFLEMIRKPAVREDEWGGLMGAGKTVKANASYDFEITTRLRVIDKDTGAVGTLSSTDALFVVPVSTDALFDASLADFLTSPYAVVPTGTSSFHDAVEGLKARLPGYELLWSHTTVVVC